MVTPGAAAPTQLARHGSDGVQSPRQPFDPKRVRKAMSQDTRPRPPAPPDRHTGLDAATGPIVTAARSLLSCAAHSSRLGDVLPQLHQRTLEVTGGVGSLLFEINLRSGM